MEKVDVCIVTLRGLSQEFYDKVHRAVPVNDIIIDSTTKPLGKAREAVIKKVTTEKFVFVDDDIFLPENWFETIMKYWKDQEVGWLEGWAVPSNPRWYRNWAASRFKEAKPQVLAYNGRGFTLDTIVRTDLVRDWVSPPNLDFFEDLALSNHVISKGYRVLRVPVECEHRITYDVFKQMKKGIKDADKSRNYKIKYAVTTFLSGSKAAFKTGDFAIMYNAAKLGIVVLRS